MAIKQLIKTLGERKSAVVTGSNFIGRTDLVYDMIDYFYCSDIGKNITVNGLPRVGKTSLLRHSARLSREQPEFSSKTLIVYIEMGGEFLTHDIDYIYRTFVIKISEELDEAQRLYSVLLEKDYNELKQYRHNGKVFEETTHYLEHFLKDIKKNGLTVRLVLDEFDYILKICSINGKLNVDDVNRFYSKLRTIITDNENYSVKVSLISRNRLSEMEPPGIESKLSGVCESLTLVPFNKKEMDEYWEHLRQWDDDGILTKDYTDIIERFAGHIPYWLDVANATMLNNISRGKGQEEKEECMYRTMRDEYEHVLKMMGDSRYLEYSKGSLKSKLLQLMVGPRYNLTKNDTSRLTGYAIVTKQNLTNGACSYTSLSPVFEEYLQFVPSETPIWDSIFLLEQKMRRLIKECFLVEYNGDWIKDFSLKYGSNNNGLIGRLIKDRDKSIKLFGGDVSTHLVDYLYIRDYFTYFIKDNWDWFKKVFKSYNGDINLFKHRMSFLCDVRNPLAHSNGDFLTTDDISRAEDYCSNINSQIDEFMESYLIRKN